MSQIKIVLYNQSPFYIQNYESTERKQCEEHRLSLRFCSDDLIYILHSFQLHVIIHINSGHLTGHRSSTRLMNE